MGLLSWLKRKKANVVYCEKKPFQQPTHWMEGIEELSYEFAYTQTAVLHMRKVLSYYSRYNHFTDAGMDFDSTLECMKAIGLMHPCADDIRYLRNLKIVSKRPRYAVSYSYSDFV